MLPERLLYGQRSNWSRTERSPELAKGSSLRSIRPGYLLVVLSAFLFAAGGNAVKALFRLGYSPLVLAQLRIWFAFAWLFGALLLFRPSRLRVPRRELPALAVFGGIGLAGVQLSYYLTIARINIAVALRVQELAAEMEHSLGNRGPEDITIAESMDALYDLQDGLMLTLDGVVDEEEV